MDEFANVILPFMPHCSQPSVDGGYDCVFIDRKFAEYYECTICSKVFRNPFLAVCCGENFCEVCIKKWREEKTACPHCREDGFKVVRNREKVREVKALRVYCTKSRQQCEGNRYRDGCDWRGKLGRLERHLNANPTPPRTQMKGCLFVEVECKFCHEQIMRCYLRHHQDNCQLRDYTCPYCGYSDTYKFIEEQHLETCQMLPVPCDSCGLEIEKCNLEYHINTDCPLIYVKCVLAPIGCNGEFKREDMSEHMREHQMVHEKLVKDTENHIDAAETNLFSEIERQQQNISQIKTLESTLAEKACVVNKQDKHINSLSDENASLRQRNNSLSDEKASLERTNDSLSDKNASLEHRNDSLSASFEHRNNSLLYENASLRQRSEKLESVKQNLWILTGCICILLILLVAMLVSNKFRN